MENTLSRLPSAVPQSPLSVHPMSSQERMLRLDEDWTGITDPALRKKLQNKINQRALRARKRDQRKLEEELRTATSKAGARRRYVLILPRSDQVPDGPYHHRRQMLSSPRTLSEAIEMMARFNAEAYERYYAGDPCLDHLLTLSKFNVLRALVDNLAALGLSLQDVEDDTALSPFNSTTQAQISHYSHHYSDRSIVPASLLPTAVQRSVPHHPWLDCFPFPRIRDNLINSPEGFDDCELCTDIMDPAKGTVGIMVWGDPWLPQSWEVTESFLQKWSWVIEGCSEILVHSNYWRARRSLDRLEISVGNPGSMK